MAGPEALSLRACNAAWTFKELHIVSQSLLAEATPIFQAVLSARRVKDCFESFRQG